MSLTQSRQEKQTAIIEAAGEMRNALAGVAQRNELNIAEAMTAATHALVSVIVGGYAPGKNREIVLGSIPDLMRASIPDWERIYASFNRRTDESQ